ncbi:hypothetical protein [Nocardiopsis sp. NPDC058789]|uniref:Uncharacterized protein n=1 Tax=Nocardiopsis eucommiae TaxID=2831970 RepID=A0A975L7Q4_9ACTN|nr:hypothetical protein KGD82_13875 [Nocardiopsis eucommiae]
MDDRPRRREKPRGRTDTVGTAPSFVRFARDGPSSRSTGETPTRIGGETQAS